MSKINIADLKIGQKVHYQPDHYIEEDKWENGVVKSIPEWTTDSAFVVYNCAGEWDNFKNYTAANTNIRDLKLGWRHEEEVNH